MNVVRYANLNSRVNLAPLARIFGAISFFAFLGGCFSSTPTPSTPAPVISFTDLKNRVGQIRGLSLKRNITIEATTSNGDAGASDKTLTEMDGPTVVTQLARAYKRIGLLPENTDFAKALADYRRLDRIAYYEAERTRVVVRPEASSLGRAFSATDPRVAAEVPAIFGIVQALDEQHFQWQERIKSIALEDRQLALRALAVGDATLVALTRVSGSKTPAVSPAIAETLGRLASAVEKLASGLPDFLRWKLVFPYREGSQFVSWAHATKGWNGVNALFANPPLSTSQILHPERYYVQRENPLRLYPWGLARRMKESAVVEQTLGEYLTRLLLSTARSENEAAQIASGWQGDSLSAYQEGDRLVTAWISAWKTEKEAREFFRAYASVQERSHRIRWQESTNRNDNLQADISGGQSMVLQIKGPLVLLLDGLPLARSLELAQETWKDLETDRESIAIPFDTAAGKIQLASRRR